MQAAGQGSKRVADNQTKSWAELRFCCLRHAEQTWKSTVVRQCVCDNVENNAEASQTIGHMVYLFLEHNSGGYGLRTAVQDQA